MKVILAVAILAVVATVALLAMCTTTVQRLPNGNTVMSNWLGHGQFGKAPHLIEVTRDKRVVWTFADHAAMKTISRRGPDPDAAGRPARRRDSALRRERVP